MTHDNIGNTGPRTCTIMLRNQAD